MPNLRWLKLNKTGLEALPDELSHLMKLVSKKKLLLFLVLSTKPIYFLGIKVSILVENYLLGYKPCA